MKTINVSNYHPQSAFNTAATDLINCPNYDSRPIKVHKRLSGVAISPARLVPEQINLSNMPLRQIQKFRGAPAPTALAGFEAGA